MIVVSGTITFNPDKTDVVVAGIDKLLPPTRAEEGNIEYGYSISTEDAGTMRVFERWADEDALNTHMTTPHLIEFLGLMGEAEVSGVDLWRYDVESASKLM